jgi:serine/threonine-protein kinase
MSSLSLRAGKSVLGGHSLKRLLGKGSFGHVWESEGPHGEGLALKFIRCGGSDLAAPHEVRNILSVRDLQHPHLIRVDRVWAERGYIVVVMELADGSLQQLSAICQHDYASPMSPDYVCYYLSQAADALDFLNTPQHRIGGNRVGIQHRDIKPSNLLVQGETVKLCDFGLACTLGSTEVPQRPAGSIAYAAPEVFQGLLSRWSDQFSLAVSYCELRGGRRPFANLPATFGTGYVHPEPDLDMLPADERPIIARGLARDPWNRWNSCGELMLHLNRVAGQKTA